MKFDPKALSFRDLDEIARKRGHKGVVAAADADGTKGFLPWQHASRKGTRGKKLNPLVQNRLKTREQQLLAKLYEDLPPIVRREPRQRYEVLLNQLVEQGLKTYRAYGYPVWPKSIQQELKVLGWKEGDPDFYAQAEALAGKFIKEYAQKQKAKDQRKSALDWHGHYSA